MRVSGGSESQASITLARSRAIRPFSSSTAPDFAPPVFETRKRLAGNGFCSIPAGVFDHPAGGRELTAVTLRQLETVEVQVSVVEQNTRQLADSTNRVADVIPTKIPMPRVPVTKRFSVSRHRRLRWENRSTPDQRQKPQAMAT